ncbi:MAG: ATP-dependent DNA helicase RecG [Oscillospiraceae bacterium]|nr:ATP-dependent DNA helicase RecG [Oscillospiraceae bacterium]MBQ9905382.1 ATP-dependent DNA helicase RecG [Oscillospiraceae bacterium]
MMNELYQPIETLAGVGEKRAAKYHKLGIHTPYDLLFHFPRTYIDYSKPVYIADAENGIPCAVRCTVVQKLAVAFVRKGFTIYRVLVTDGISDMLLVFYNTPYTYQAMKSGEEYYAYGKITGGFLRREMQSPQVQKVCGAMLLQPVYPQTTGLTSAMMRTNIQRALLYLEKQPVETMPDSLMQDFQLIPLVDALRAVHRPESAKELEAARHRLAFEELLQFQLGTLMLRHRSSGQTAVSMSESVSIQDFYDHLPFSLTSAQQKSIQTICKDLCGSKPMNRLLQGDVGSGKTAVATAAAAFTAKNGMQTVLMAPTEILAQQHLHTMTEFLSPLGIQPVLLTGSTKAKEKREIKKQIADGTAQVVIGTHAVIQKDIDFHTLGLVITDEQHRFGVAQRAALAEKGGCPHKLVMSATPIPRTLALIIYGDLDITLLDEMPKGRLPVQTFAVTGGFRERAYSFIKSHLDAGEQAYLVCAMIEESDTLENVQAAETYAETLKQGAFSDYRVGLLHGKMKPAEKEAVMAAMKAHEIDLLVCTTVVEVGVDVPNATLILIENADRFGLAQLHQLRGRVGRGAVQSYCILVTDSKNEDARERLKIMSRTTNGFAIAEEDLRLRGPGDFFGHAQHGMPPLMQAAFCSNMPLVSETQMAAKQLLASDPELKDPAHQALRTAVLQLFAKNGENGLN